mgnify:CR=1 FL=1
MDPTTLPALPSAEDFSLIALFMRADPIVKAVMASTIGGKALALRVAPAFLVMLAGGGVGLALMWLVR